MARRLRSADTAAGLERHGAGADTARMPEAVVELRTVVLTPRELSVVRNLVRSARGRATPADMQWVMDLDRLTIVLDEAMRGRRPPSGLRGL
jgi:hypothetical protein